MPGPATTPARRRSHCLTTDANVTFDPRRGYWIYHPRCPGDIPPRVIYFGGEATNRAAYWERIGPNFYGDRELDGHDENRDVYKTWRFGDERTRRHSEAAVAAEEEGESRWEMTCEELRERDLEQMRLLPAPLEPVRLWEMEGYEEEYEEEWKAGYYDNDNDDDDDDEDELPWWHTPARDLEWWEKVAHRRAAGLSWKGLSEYSFPPPRPVW